MTMENLFSKVGLNYQDMDYNVNYDIRDKNIKVKSFNHKTNQAEMKKIVSLVRKEDSKVYHLVNKAGDILLKCSGAHRIFDNDKKEYFHARDIKSGKALNNVGKKVNFFVKETSEIMPIVDMEVEDNENYFTNGILSHNTTSGGKALQFYASIRLKLSKVGVIEEGKGDDKEKVSVRTRVEAVKNKTFPPFRKAEYVVVFGKGIDNEAGILDELIEHEIILKKGGWYSIDGSNVAQGLVNLKQYLAENPAIFDQLKVKLATVSKTDEPVIENNDGDSETMTDDDIADAVENDTESGSV